MSRFPVRTLILMTLALFAFISFWWRTHQQPAGAPVIPVQMIVIDGGAP